MLVHAIAAAVAAIAAASAPGPDGNAWPGFLRTPAHAAVSAARGPVSGRVRWSRRIEGAVAPGAAIDGSGVAYVAGNGGVLHALRVRDGRELWRFNAHGSYGSDLSTVPALAGAGVVLWPGPHHSLYALSRTGRLLWRLGASDDLLSPLIRAGRGPLYVADQSGNVHAYRMADPRRRPVPLWSRRLPGGSLGSPALGSDGTVYETAGGSLYALGPDGGVRWRFGTHGLVEVSPAVTDDGTIVFGSNDTLEYGVRPDGRVRWRYRIGDYTYSSPSALPGNLVAFGDHRGGLNILDATNGRVVSRPRGRGQIWTAAVTDARGTSYFATRLGHLYGFARSGRRLFDDVFGTTFDSYPALAADGTLIIGTDDGRVLAIHG